MGQAEPHRSPEEAHLAEIRSSRAWNLLQMYLMFRRDLLFREPLSKTDEILVNRGAIQEVQRMLDSPDLMLDFFRNQRERVEAVMGRPAGDPATEPPWYGDPDVQPPADTRPTE
jgi:hypothetical protein